MSFYLQVGDHLDRRDIYLCRSAEGAREVQISSLIIFGDLNPEVEKFSLHTHYPQAFVWPALKYPEHLKHQTPSKIKNPE